MLSDFIKICTKFINDSENISNFMKVNHKAKC